MEVSQDVRQVCRNLMAEMPVCYLTSIDADGYPHTTAMLNLCCAKQYPSLLELHEDPEAPFLLYMSTGTQSNKTARMQANPKVSVYFCDPERIVGLMLGGEIEIITDRALKSRIWQEGWTIYYPNGPQGPEYGILRLVPKVAKGWNQNGPFELTL